MSADTVPPPRKTMSLQALMKLAPRAGHEWNVFAYVLNRDMIQPDGTLDDLHAVVFPLGSFSDRESAAKYAESVIQSTGHPKIIVSRFAMPVQLTLQPDPSVVQQVTLDTNNELVKLEDKQYKRDKEAYEKRLKLESDLTHEAENETDINHIEHFKRQAYLALKHKAAYELHMAEAAKIELNYEKRRQAVQEHYSRHPEHEAEWLPYLKTKLEERGEQALYTSLAEGYARARNELLGLPKN